MNVSAGVARDRDVCELARFEARELQRFERGKRRESRLMLQAAEALFLNCAFDAARAQQRRTRIAVVGIQAENVHDVDVVFPLGALPVRRISSMLMSTR